MHSLLESYLSEVEAQLTALPSKKRREELSEMRAHLENAVIVSRELGQTEDEAVQNVVAQFGTPQELGRSTVIAWRRGVMLDRRSFWGAAICTFALMCLADFSEGSLVKAYFDLVRTANLPTAHYVMLDYWLLGPVVAGTITGSLFSKKAMAGNAFGIVTYSVLCLCIYVHWIVQPIHLQHLRSFSPATLALRFLAPLVIKGLLASTSAWSSSRFRWAWGKSGRLVRA